MSKYNRVRLTPEERKQQIVNAALDDALEHGLYAFSIANVSRSIQDRHCSKATIKHYFTMEALRTAVIKEAIRRDDNPFDVIVAQAISMNHPATDHFADDERAEFLECLI